MFNPNRPCILTTVSKTTGETCYFDGYAWTLLRENARIFACFEQADRQRERAEGSFNQSCDVEYA